MAERYCMCKLNIEIQKTRSSVRTERDIEILARNFTATLQTIPNGMIYEKPSFKSADLKECVDKITLVLSNFPYDKAFSVSHFITNAQLFVYQLIDDGPVQEEISDDDEKDSSVVASHHWSLPNVEFEELWNNLFFDSNIKEELINYAENMLKLADHGCNPKIITSNRLILFHGPPGTGKTTLSKAVAQKLSVRFSKRFLFAQLIEINSHSLFSKWFSESGKLVMKMFDKIRELLQNADCLVFVLVDEIESLTKARQSSISGNEPSDAVRVVNAVLTQLDQLRRFPNVLILTTSNLTNAVDDAFLDRADIKQLVPPPSDVAIYKILHSCLKEYQRISLVTNEYVDNKPDSDKKLSRLLYEVAKKCIGMSGRALRKLPVLALSFTTTTSISTAGFIEALSLAADKQLSGTCRVINGNGPNYTKYNQSIPIVDMELSSGDNAAVSIFNDTLDIE